MVIWMCFFYFYCQCLYYNFFSFSLQFVNGQMSDRFSYSLYFQEGSNYEVRILVDIRYRGILFMNSIEREDFDLNMIQGEFYNVVNNVVFYNKIMDSIYLDMIVDMFSYYLFLLRYVYFFCRFIQLFVYMNNRFFENFFLVKSLIKQLFFFVTY